MNIQNHLVSKLIFILASSITILISILAIIYFGFEKNILTSDLRTNSIQTANRLSNSLSYPLWNLNNQEIEKSISLEMSNPDIVAIVINDYANKNFLRGEKRDNQGNNIIFYPNKEEIKNLNKSFIVVTKPVIRGNETIGSVTIYYADTMLNRSLNTLLLEIFGLALLLIGISVIVLFLSIQRVILFPLFTLEKSIKEIGDNKSFSVKIPVTSSDEIGTLAKIFNNMTDQLQVSYLNLEQKVSEKTVELTTNVTELEHTKQAMLNLLEDLQQEKGKIEFEKTKDDALLGSIGDSIIAADVHGKIILMNHAGEGFFNQKMGDSLGRNLTEIIPLVDERGKTVMQEKRPALQAMKTKNKITTSAFSVLKKDGTKIPVTITASPILFNDELTGVITIFHDIRKEKDVDRMKTEFISLASHQLRTPLTAMKWFLEMLLGGEIGELTIGQKEIINNINESNERMIELVNALLNVSRIESGRIIISPEPTDPRELLNTIKTELKGKFEEKKQKLIINIPDDLPKINLDRKLIREVYLNLLTNAIKYSPEESTISVTLSKKDDKLVSQVKDSGYGIPEKDKNKVFTKFYRGDNIIKKATCTVNK